MRDDERSATDEALDIATDRTRRAEIEFLRTPPQSEEAVVEVRLVERRAEDLAVLADEAAEDSTSN